MKPAENVRDSQGILGPDLPVMQNAMARVVGKVCVKCARALPFDQYYMQKGKLLAQCRQCKNVRSEWAKQMRKIRRVSRRGLLHN